ncbi:MAG: acyltransferase, partial [Gemmatimonadaceae bacterium]
MPYLPLRKVPDSPTRTLANEWLDEIRTALADTNTDRSVLCRRALTAIYYPEYADRWESAVTDPSIPSATRLALASMDPRNITLEPEYYGDCIDERFQRVKPLLWLWYSFDRSPLGGQNVWLGIELRRML